MRSKHTSGLTLPSPLCLDTRVQLAQPLLEPAEPGVSALRERVDELEQCRIEPSLVEGKWLDVPAHELAQGTLDGHEQKPTGLSPGTGAVEERAFGADRPQTLGLVAPQRKTVVGVFGQTAVRALDLSLKECADRLEVRLLGDGSIFRHDAILGCAS